MGDTKTTDAYFVLNYRNIQLDGDTRLHTNLAAKFSKTAIDAITRSDALAANGYNIFQRIEKGLISKG